MMNVIELKRCRHAWPRTGAIMAIAFSAAMILTAHSAALDDEADAEAEDSAPVYVLMSTSKGEIYLELNREKAPITVANFVKYVADEFYDGTIFHRVIPTFMIQGGGFTPEMTQKPTRAPIVNESQNGLSNRRGTIAMARTPDPDSATAQFFINVADNARLDGSPGGGPGYAVFGRVIHGMDVVDAIRRVETTIRGSHRDVPREPITIEKVRIITKEQAERAKRGEDEEKPEAKPEVEEEKDPDANDG
jgi:cyclophilin family peptidyl-prolyl cis-trans isomerase